MFMIIVFTENDIKITINFIYEGHNIIMIKCSMDYALYTTTIILYTDASYIHKLSFSNKYVFNLLLKTSTVQLRFTDESNGI